MGISGSALDTLCVLSLWTCHQISLSTRALGGFHQKIYAVSYSRLKFSKVAGSLLGARMNLLGGPDVNSQPYHTPPYQGAKLISVAQVSLEGHADVCDLCCILKPHPRL